MRPEPDLQGFGIVPLLRHALSPVATRRGRLRATAIGCGGVAAGPSSDATIAAGYGATYLTLAANAGGGNYPVCSADWAPISSSLAKNVVKTTFTVCDDEIKVPVGATFVPSAIVLTTVEAGPPQTTTQLVHVNDAAGCANQPLGWTFEDPTWPAKVILCESKCVNLQASDLLSIDDGCK